MANFICFLTASLLLMFSLACVAQVPPSNKNVMDLYSGIKAQETILINGRYMNKSLIPVEEALGCSQCGGNNDCLIPCNTFYRLLHSITEIHEEHQKLQAVREQNADDKQIELLSIILNRLSNQACALLISKLGVDNFSCTYSELMKTKAKLEILFVGRKVSNILDILDMQQQELRLKNEPDRWTEELVCNITDMSLMRVINSAFGRPLLCPSS
ncbi:uncharacterized protein LOC135335637 [Halichondria panicea]|uniref:uncharacterized protein LOC135335637 n=1 Tax=Halichondria panicea TaxID=6063 RepID=UPI00312B7AC3